MDNESKKLLGKLESTGIDRDRTLNLIMRNPISEDRMYVYNRYDEILEYIKNGEIDTTDILSIGIIESFIGDLNFIYENL